MACLVLGSGRALKEEEGGIMVLGRRECHFLCRDVLGIIMLMFFQLPLATPPRRVFTARGVQLDGQERLCGAVRARMYFFWRRVRIPYYSSVPMATC